jgi:DNA polymerase IV
MTIRKIIHVDMDAFYASVEQRDHPAWLGKPVIVGSPPDERGVVATCSYEARKFGVRSAMSSKQAFKLCPEGIFVPLRFSAYKEVSLQIRAIFAEYTDLIEPLSLDEAYLDVTLHDKMATLIAKELKKRIFAETGLKASAGVSFNKFLAKIASDWQKPDGLTVITPELAPQFIDQLPIKKFHGIGKVTEEKMVSLGIHNGKELKEAGLEKLIKHFGKSGHFFFRMVHCKDDRPVNPTRIRKSLGTETTFQTDILDPAYLHEVLYDLSAELENDLKNKNLFCKTITLKLRYFNFITLTRSKTLSYPFQDKETLFSLAKHLLSMTAAGRIKVRLIGLTTSHFTDYEHQQLLFDFIKLKETSDFSRGLFSSV